MDEELMKRIDALQELADSKSYTIFNKSMFKIGKNHQSYYTKRDAFTAGVDLAGGVYVEIEYKVFYDTERIYGCFLVAKTLDELEKIVKEL